MFGDKTSQPSTSSTQPSRHFKLSDFVKVEPPSPTARPYTISEILKATNGFDESLIVGRGSFGNVYKGTVSHGGCLVVAAIKRLDPRSWQGKIEFWAEVQTLSTVRHDNVVSMLGYCEYEKQKEAKAFAMLRSKSSFESCYDTEKIILYEYLPNGTLSDHLHKLGTPLSFLERLSIGISSSLGLHHIHACTASAIHRDVKTTNILLDARGVAKITDFGLAKVRTTPDAMSTFPKGTCGYIDPHYYKHGKVTTKSDVYSFGVVLLELLFRKRSLENHESLVSWVDKSVKNNMPLLDIIDPMIKDEISPESLRDFFEIARRCLRAEPDERPDMAEVAEVLDSVWQLQKRLNSQLHPVPLDAEISGGSMLPSQGVKVFTFNDLEKATRLFKKELSTGEEGDVKVFLGWVQQETLAPSNEIFGIAVAVKRVFSDTPTERHFDDGHL